MNGKTIKINKKKTKKIKKHLQIFYIKKYLVIKIMELEKTTTSPVLTHKEQFGQKFLKPYCSPLIINSEDYNKVVSKLREFFTKREFIEVSPQIASVF